MPKPNKQHIIDAIISGIKVGKGRGELMGTIGKKWEVSRTTFDRYWKTAQEQHTVAQQAIKEQLALLDSQSAIDARKKAIMSADERKEYLTKIILGQIEVPYTEVKWNPETKKFVTMPFVELASHGARISAISELNKMGGDYAPTKVAQTDTEGNTVPAMSDNQFFVLLKTLNEAAKPG